MSIQITIGDLTVTATLNDSRTAKLIEGVKFVDGVEEMAA